MIYIKNNGTSSVLFVRGLILFLLSVHFQSMAVSARFAFNGPVVTLTLKDRSPPPPGSTATSPQRQDDADDFDGDDESSSSAYDWQHQEQTKQNTRIDLSSLRPTALWEVASLAPPLPYWIPALKQLRARVGCSCDEYSTRRSSGSGSGGMGIFGLARPSWVEGTAKFATSLGELIVQPTHEFNSGLPDGDNSRTTILVEASRGLDWILMRFGMTSKQVIPSLDTVRGSFVANLPLVSVSTIRVTPSLDVPTRDFACQVEAVTGGFGRTRAVLNLERDEPTLSIIHALTQRHTIAPTLNLRYPTTKLSYQWNVLLGRSGTSSIRTKVDPNSAIDVTWTDQSETGGTWVSFLKAMRAIFPSRITNLTRVVSFNLPTIRLRIYVCR